MKRRYFYGLALTACISSLTFGRDYLGYHIGYNTVFRDEYDDFTNKRIFYLTGGALVGSFSAWFLTERLGRRKCFIYGALLNIAGCVIVNFS